MTDRNRCLNCNRGIDPWSRICPFCNWNQANTAPPPPLRIVTEPVAPPMIEERAMLKRRGLMLGGGVLVLIASFAVGVVINRDDAPAVATAPSGDLTAKDQRPPMRADTPLVAAGAGGVEQVITSAPATATNGDAPSEYSRADATAVSSLEYARLEQRARSEKRRPAALVDPRSLTGPAHAQAPARRRASAAPTGATVASGARTRPIPKHQPVPPLRSNGTARLTLQVGADGLVKGVTIDRPLDSGGNAALLTAVRSWRFKPATENGQPVAAPYSVDIRFN